MEAIRTETLQQLEELLIDSDKKAGCMMLFETAFVRMKYELENKKEKEESKNNKNTKINEWRGDPPEIVKRNEYNGTIEQIVFDISKLDEEGELSQSVMIGGLNWQMKVRQTDDEEKLFFYLSCKSKKATSRSKWQCTAIYLLRIMGQSKTNLCYRRKKMAQFNEIESSDICMVKLQDLLNSKYNIRRHETINIEAEIVVLASSGVPRPESSFNNKDYQQTFGTTTHIFSGISSLDEKLSQPFSFKIGGFQWNLSFSKNANSVTDYLKLSLKRDSGHKLELSCVAKAEFRLLKQSESDEFYSKHQANVLNGENNCLSHCCFIEMDELMDPNNDYIKNDSIIVQVCITIFKPIDSET